MKFKVEVSEILQRTVEIEAKDLTEALIMVGKQYDNGEIELNSMDFVGYSIKEVSE